MSEKNFPYLHGFSATEQERLKQQARFTENTVYRDIDLSESESLLEVGCGVGAQTEILLRRYPNLKIHGIDLNDQQLSTAKKYLATLAYAKDRYTIDKMNAEDMSFDSGEFDAAFLCWVLEHVPSPARVLSEFRRVLKPGGKVFITEVMNSTFFLEPYSPNVWKYWQAFNDFQFENAGDPFVGSKLGNLLLASGYKNVQTSIKSMHLDNRNPKKRKATIEFWTELLLSGADTLLQKKVVDKELVDGMVAEMKKVAKDPNAVFLYSFMQATGEV